MGPKTPGTPAVPKLVGGLFRTKSLDSILADAEKPEYQLKRALGPYQLTLLGIGAIIGAGIFATIGTAAAGDANRLGAGPALTLSFMITAITCGFTALCYAEFAAMVPISGSAYTYSYATLGEVIAWIIGWDLIIEYAVGNIAVAISWANYFKTLLKNLPDIKIFGQQWHLSIEIPAWISTDFRTAAQMSAELAKQGKPTLFDEAPHIFGVPIICNLVAVSIVVLITLILIWGIRESARFNAVMVCIKIVVLTFFIVVGLMWMPWTEKAFGSIQVTWPTNWSPYIPTGWAGISAGAAVVFFAYIGFDAVSTVAEETERPQRNLPIGIIASLIICTLFYIAVSMVFTGLVPFQALKQMKLTEQAEPLTVALEYAHPGVGWAVELVAFGSVIAHTAVLLVYQLGQPRIFFAMSRDGLLPPAFSRVHKRFRTPHVSTILTGVFVAVFAAFASIDEMVDLTNIGTLFAFILVCAGIIVLRRKDPGRPRPFRVPSGWRWAIFLYVCVAVPVYYFVPASQEFRLIILAGAAVIFALERNYIFPLLGILSCMYLIYYLPANSWLRFAAWLNFGLAIYVGYGCVHSRLTGRADTGEGGGHDASTAYNGAWLALGGAATLLLMHLLTSWLEAADNQTAEGEWAKAAGAFREAMTLESWSQLSWFLIVPLAINAFVLCPIVIRRVRRAERAGATRDGRAATSRALAWGLLAATAVYFVWLTMHNWPGPKAAPAVVVSAPARVNIKGMPA